MEERLQFFRDLPSPYQILDGVPYKGPTRLRVSKKPFDYSAPDMVVIGKKRYILNHEWFEKPPTSMSQRALFILSKAKIVYKSKFNKGYYPKADIFNRLFTGDKNHWELNDLGAKRFVQIADERDITMLESEIPYIARQHMLTHLIREYRVVTPEQISKVMSISTPLAKELLKDVTFSTKGLDVESFLQQAELSVGSLDDFRISDALLRNITINDRQRMALCLRFNTMGLGIPRKNTRLQHTRDKSVYMRVVAGIFGVNYKSMYRLPINIEDIIEEEKKCTKFYTFPDIRQGFTSRELLALLSYFYLGKAFPDETLLTLATRGILTMSFNTDYGSIRTVSKPAIYKK